MIPTVRMLNLTAAASLVALIFFSLAWELWLAPLRPGGSMLALKPLPLMAAVFGILRGRRYTHQWTSMLALAYVAEGIVRAMSDRGPSQQLAAAEIVLASVLFFSCVFYARLTTGGSRRGRRASMRSKT
ncbi:MAG: DUF2069 domain-containing protein [Rhodocyclaceae bacterium]|nr:DUF2069 domain-containing protein [Rhodocyclaceae bacterium]